MLTNHGPSCLTSVILRELVFPTWYSRSLLCLQAWLFFLGAVLKLVRSVLCLYRLGCFMREALSMCSSVVTYSKGSLRGLVRSFAMPTLQARLFREACFGYFVYNFCLGIHEGIFSCFPYFLRLFCLPHIFLKVFYSQPSFSPVIFRVRY